MLQFLTSLTYHSISTISYIFTRIGFQEQDIINNITSAWTEKDFEFRYEIVAHFWGEIFMFFIKSKSTKKLYRKIDNPEIRKCYDTK